MADSIQLARITLPKLPEVADAILRFGKTHSDSRVFAFNGEMGTGKTTLIKEICLYLGSHDNFSSPSYSIVNEYALPGCDEKIYHIDLYRLKTVEEAIAIGIEEYLDSGQYCFIEWPALVESILPAKTVFVEIIAENNDRKIAIFMGKV
jgi:tRNA threonylcarbamoyladenosine biosynthesis protein TsaE